MKFKTKPYKHQLEVLDTCKDKNEFALFWEMGTGKSFGTINLLRQIYYKEKQVVKTLILSPIVTLRNWKREFEMHSFIPPQDVVVLDRSGKHRLQDMEKIKNQNKIVIVNYEAFQNTTFVELVLEFGARVLVCDESHLLKNHKSKRAKNVVKLSDTVDYRFILTGTPILNSALDIFNQYRVLDGGDTFGSNYWTFLHRYFYDQNASWAKKPNHFPKYAMRNDRAEELNSKIYSKAMRVTKESCLDLPPLVEKRLEVPLSPGQKKMYKEMKNDFITFIADNKDKPQAVVAQLAVTKAIRLQQIVTGFVQTEEGETIALGDIPRLQVVAELLQEITPNHKVIIWCSFKHNYEQIAEICKRQNIKYCMITGEQNARDKDRSIVAFNTESDVRACIANRRAGGIGVNLVSASYSIVYSRNFSLGEEKQSAARNYRAGSEVHESITKIELISTGTIDELIGKALEGKQHISDLILDPENL